jgi:hypothetical protein
MEINFISGSVGYFALLLANRADSSNNGGDRAESRDKGSSDRQNLIGDRKSLLDSRNGLLGQPALGLGVGGKRESGGCGHFKEWLYYTWLL